MLLLGENGQHVVARFPLRSVMFCCRPDGFEDMAAITVAPPRRRPVAAEGTPDTARRATAPGAVGAAVGSAAGGTTGGVASATASGVSAVSAPAAAAAVSASPGSVAASSTPAVAAPACGGICHLFRFDDPRVAGMALSSLSTGFEFLSKLSAYQGRSNEGEKSV